jgi:MATE family multidrug resistance protein
MRAGLTTLLTLAWPVILARATQSVIGFFDALMVAPYGDAALAAATTGALNTVTIVIFPMGIALIVQSFASQLKGRGDLATARRYAWYGLVLALAAAVLALIATPFIDDALALFDYEPEVAALQSEYLSWRLTGIFAMVGTEALGNWFGGLGNTRLQMIAGAIAMVCNIFFNWVFIYGNLGAPEMGVAGAALASAVASWCGFAFVAWAFWRTRRRGARGLGLRLAELLRMLRFGLPNGLNWFLEFAAFMWFINTVLTDIGTTALAAFNVVLYVNSVAFMPAFGLASAGAILVGQAVGSGRRDDVPGILKLTAAVAVVWMLSMAIVYVAAPRAIMSLFVASDDPGAPALLATGALMLAISAAWQIFDGLAMSVSEALRATGDTAWCLRARIVLAWFVFAPIGWYTVVKLDGGVPAAMACMVGYLMLLAGTMIWRFRSGAWRRIELVEELPPEALAS